MDHLKLYEKRLPVWDAAFRAAAKEAPPMEDRKYQFKMYLSPEHAAAPPPEEPPR